MVLHETTYNEVALEVLGEAHKSTEEWITEDTWEEIELRKQCKKKILQEKDQIKNMNLKTGIDERTKM